MRVCSEPGCDTILRRTNPSEFCCVHAAGKEICDLELLDGPKFEAWLREVFDLTGFEKYYPGDFRLLRYAREGRTVSVYTADRILLRLGGHLADIPASCYLTEPKAKRQPKTFTPEEKALILSEHMDKGEPMTVVARRFDIDPRTIYNWKQEHLALEEVAA